VSDDPRLQQLRRLAELTEKINSGLVVDEVLNHLYASFHDIIPYDRIGLSLLEREGKTVRARWARSEAPKLWIERGYEAALAGSSLQPILETGQPRILNDLEAHLREHPKSDSTWRVVQEGIRSSLTCPLIAMGKPVGFLFFSSNRPGTYRDAHVELYQQIAGQLALIIEKSRLYEQVLELSDLKSRFLGIVVHDMRNPLTIIKGFAALFVDGTLDAEPESRKEMSVEILRAAETMRRMIEDLLDMSAIQTGKLALELKPMDLGEYLRGSGRRLSLLAIGKGIEVRFDVEPGALPVRMDPMRIEQVLSNLVSNAVKFSKPKTVVRVSARKVSGAVQVTVADEGPGIPKGEAGLLFSEFSRTSIRPTGDEKTTGLGLAIVKRLVDAHGGRVWAENRPGKDSPSGAAFHFTLPSA